MGKSHFPNPSKGLRREGYQHINNSDWNTKLDTPCCLLAPCINCGELREITSYQIPKHMMRVDILGGSRHNICFYCRNKKLRANFPNPYKGKEKNGHKYVNHSEWNTKLDTPCCLLAPCIKCNELKIINDFYVQKKRNRIDVLGFSRGNTCKNCQNEVYKEKPNQLKLLYAARSRAKAGDFECSISENDIKIPQKCPVLGIDLFQNIGCGAKKGAENENAPSIDRVNTKYGYIAGNIAVISKRANSRKSDASIKEIFAILAYYIEQQLGNFKYEETEVPYIERELVDIIEIFREYAEKVGKRK